MNMKDNRGLHHEFDMDAAKVRAMLDDRPRESRLTILGDDEYHGLSILQRLNALPASWKVCFLLGVASAIMWDLWGKL